jgi:hypothetical protein
MVSHRLLCLLSSAVAGFVLAGRPASLAAGTVSMGTADSSPLEIVDSSVSLDLAARTATFDLQFNHAPDFHTLDSAGRVEDSFQYFINPNWSGNTQNLQLNYGQFSDVVRGDEIHTSGKLLIRDATAPPNPDPNSGGWGPVVAALPFHVKGDSLAFTATFSDLRAPKGTFSYEVYTTHFGGTVSTLQSWAVPMPPAAWSGLAMLGAMGALTGARKLRRFVRFVA